MEHEQNSGGSTAKKNIKGFHFKWWLWLIIGIAVVAVISILLMKFTGSESSKDETVLTQADTTEEIKIKQNMSSLRGDIVRYFGENKTYEGWKPNDGAINQVKAMGSELKTQALNKDGYIIYAKLPGSKTIFCMDNKGFTGEVKSLSSFAKACK